MSEYTVDRRTLSALRPSGEAMTWVVTIALLTLGSLVPQASPELFGRFVTGFVQLTPVIAIAAILAGALSISDLSGRVLDWMGTGPTRGIVIGSLGGALTPVCGLGIVPLIAVLLRQGLPLAAVMAFWVSSPITDPGMLVVTAGVLGIPFAIAKTVAAFGAGLFAGFATWLLPTRRRAGEALLRPGVAAPACDDGTAGRWPRFRREAFGNARLIARWLALALVLEIFLQRYVPPAFIESVLGDSGRLAIPLAAIVGAPLYLDGYAALPLVRGLADLGMTGGAVMALLISGAAVSLYAAIAVFSLVRWPIFALYVALAVLSALLAGYAVEAAGVPVLAGSP